MGDNFDQTCQAVIDAIKAAPEPFRLVLKKAQDNCNGDGDIVGFAGFCNALIAEMRPGETKTYLQNLRAVMLNHADSWAEPPEEATP